MFPPMEVHEHGEADSVAQRYYLKAMNCPHHHKLFAAVPRSYRDLPLRLAESIPMALRGGSETRVVSRNQNDLAKKFTNIRDSIAALNVQSSRQHLAKS